MKVKLPVPTEETEQRVLVQWLELQGLAYFHVPNSTYTKSWSIKNRNKALGVKAGVPDLFVCIPKVGLVPIELKRVKGGVVSEYQKEWLEKLNGLPGVAAHIAKGADVAIGIIESYMPLPAKKTYKEKSVF